jgi:hypothetical protein
MLYGWNFLRGRFLIWTEEARDTVSSLSYLNTFQFAKVGLPSADLMLEHNTHRCPSTLIVTYGKILCCLYPKSFAVPFQGGPEAKLIA